jgi:FkbM family methyltransferase
MDEQCEWQPTVVILEKEYWSAYFIIGGFLLEDAKLQWRFFSRFHGVPMRIFKICLYAAYTFVFARPSMQHISRGLLRLALNGVGYDNWWSFRTTGEERFLRFLALHDPKLVIDIGANKGKYSERLLALTSTRVIAFEPHPDLFDDLSKLSQNFPGRFLPVQKGVGDVTRRGTLRYGKQNSELASFCEDISEIEYVNEANKCTVEVEMVTLDSFVESSDNDSFNPNLLDVDLLKIDVEGFEVEVLSGARQFLLQRAPKFVQIEFNHHQLFRGHTFRSIALMLPQYKVFRLLPYGSGLARVDPAEIDCNIFCFSNFVFVRGDVTVAC